MFTDLINKSNSIIEGENKSWFKDENDRIFFIENTTGRKRFGRLIDCKNCQKEICVRLKDNKVYCSRKCAQIGSRVERLKLSCSNCNKELMRTKNRLQLSKKGFNFCDRKCKEKAQEIGGIVAIQPGHYGDGTTKYANKAFKHYGQKCIDCDVTLRALLEVHHIDGDRKNASISNLEVVCKNHHLLRHLRLKKNNEWVLDFKFLTPREKLKEIITNS